MDFRPVLAVIRRLSAPVPPDGGDVLLVARYRLHRALVLFRAVHAVTSLGSADCACQSTWYPLQSSTGRIRPSCNCFNTAACCSAESAWFAGAAITRLISVDRPEFACSA